MPPILPSPYTYFRLTLLFVAIVFSIIHLYHFRNNHTSVIPKFIICDVVHNRAQYIAFCKANNAIVFGE